MAKSKTSTQITDTGPIPDDVIAEAAEAAAAPEPETKAPYTPVPAPQIASQPQISEVDALGLEVIALKHRVELLERRLNFLHELFAWPPGLK